MSEHTATKDRKTALLDSAEQAARSRGFDAFSYADLAADVGIRTASIHYHFPTKADLSAALMQRYHQGFKQICADIDAQQTTGGARLAALIDRYRLAHNEATQVCLCVAFSISRQSLSEDVVSQMAAFRTMMRNWIAAVFALGKTDGSITNVQDEADEAAAILCLLEGAQLSARAQNEPPAFDEAVEILHKRTVVID
jgi:TetR/AcrR family transcriptional repressor of nem operon